MTSSRDVMFHGEVVGERIASPMVFVRFGPDWRVTMEKYADENTRFAPKLRWTNGVPFGWNSWGSIQSRLDYPTAIAVADFIKRDLQTNQFNNNGTVYVNLDSLPPGIKCCA